MAVGTRRQRAAPDIWPGFVDAITALLIIMIFVLIVFALAQFFLSADLSSRNDALRRLNLEVAELAEMLSIERSANSDLRDNLSSVSAELATSIADRDRLSNQLGELLPERDALTSMLADRTKESESFSALLSERAVERDKLIEELTKRTAERDALTVQMAELTATAKTTAAQTAKVSGELEDAYKTIGADKEKIELQLRRIASIERDILTLSEVRKKLESQVADLAQTLKTRDQTVAESRAELEARAKALAALNKELAERNLLLAERDKALADRDKTLSERDKTLADREKSLADRNRLLAARNKLLAERNTALAARTKELGVLRDRSKELTANLASEQERTLLAQKTIDENDVRLKELLGRSSKSETALSNEQKMSAAALKQVQALNLQLVALRRQLARLAAALNASEAESKSQNVQIASLGKRLNAALASKVQELARYRSEFFGRLRKVLGDRKDIRVVGDRFVFQSEVLFSSGSSDLQPLGRGQIAKLAKTLREISVKIPKEINWVLRVDGHTDVIPISTPKFASNWELSTGRAISVVKQLVEAGIPAHRLAATGFGQFQPLDPRSDEIAFRRNRRIEFKLTER